jgi:peptidoglycan biosynthesis protein MviN/MurJ (putative lipid II flippase)
LPNKPERGGLTPTVIGLMFTTWTGKMSYGYLWFMMGGKYVLKSAICSYMDYFFLFRIWKKKLNFLPLTTGPSLNIIRIYIILNIIYYVWYMFIIFKYVYWCILHLLYM